MWSAVRLDESVEPVWRANITSALAFYWSHRGDHKQALELARDAIVRHDEAGDRVGAMVALLAVGNALIEIGDASAAAATHEEVLALAIDAGEPYPQLLARVALARLDAGEQTARTHLLAALALAQLGYGSIEAVANTELAVLALSAGDLRYSEQGLDRARSNGYAEIVATALCGDGEVAHAEGDTGRARESFMEARSLGRVNSHVGVIERAEKGLAALPEDATVVSPTELAEPLSDRELSVARLLRGDLTQREIADELYIAPSTVKSHTKAIYRKLGVSKRSHAVTRAMELGLFD